MHDYWLFSDRWHTLYLMTRPVAPMQSLLRSIDESYKRIEKKSFDMPGDMPDSPNSALIHSNVSQQMQ